MTTKYQKALDHYCKGLHHIATGAAASCPECLDTYGIDSDIGLSVDEVQEILYGVAAGGSFAWSQCDTCGSKLGGGSPRCTRLGR